MVVFFLIFSGCRPDSIPEPAASLQKENDQPISGDSYIDTSIGDASYLNPLLASDSASSDICNLLYNGLIKYDKNLKLVGDLAESWEIRQGGKKIIFYLRKGVKWHDGEPFTAEDVKFTYERLIDPEVKTAYGADFQIIESVDVLDPYTLRVNYKFAFVPAIESWGMGIIPKHIYKEGNFNSHSANRRPIGTGPYIFEEWKTGEKVVLKANLNYFEGRPYIDRFIYRIIPDQAVQFLELRNDSIDSMGLTPDQYKAYPEFFRNHRKYRYPAFAYTYFGFNLLNPLFQDKRVRQAMAYATNKKEIIDGVLLGFGRPATGPFPPISWAYNHGAEGYPYDVTKARALLAEAGWKDSNGDGVLEKDGKDFEFTVLTNQGNKLRELTAVILQNHLSKVGIKMKLRVLEWATFIHQYVDKKKFEALILGWGLGIDPDPYHIWHSKQQKEGQFNFISYSNKRVDELIDQGRIEFNFEKRKKIYHKIHEILAKDLPYLFLYYPESMPVVHKRFIGPEVAPKGLGWNFRKWFSPKEYQKYNMVVQ